MMTTTTTTTTTTSFPQEQLRGSLKWASVRVAQFPLRRYTMVYLGVVDVVTLTRNDVCWGWRLNVNFYIPKYYILRRIVL